MASDQEPDMVTLLDKLHQESLLTWPVPEPAPQKVYHKSSKDDWETPDNLYQLIDLKWGPNLDVCATEQNTKCPLYIFPEMDSLKTEWDVLGSETVCWMNPPYSKVRSFVKRAAYQAEIHGITVIGLVAARVDTRWWWDHVINGASEIIFLKKRLTFKGAKHNAPFPSALVVWQGSDHDLKTSWWDWQEDFDALPEFLHMQMLTASGDPTEQTTAAAEPPAVAEIVLLPAHATDLHH